MRSNTSLGINRCDFFIAGWVVYYLQGILYEEGGTLSTALLAMILGISLFYVIKVINLPNKPPFFKGLNALVLLFSLYGIAHILFNPIFVHYRVSGVDQASYEYIKAIFLSLIPIYPFYYFSSKGLLTDKKIRLWFLVFIFSCTLTYLRTQRDVMLEKGLEEITNNSGYLMLSLFPGLVLFRKKSILQFGILAYLLIFIFMGMKRGAILIAAISLPILLWENFKLASKKQRILIFAIIIALSYLGVRFVSNQMQTNEYLMLRILETEAGNSSGRDSLYDFFWNYFIYENSFITFLFGNGANHTLDIYDMAAHNDWLEMGINQGVFGCIVFLYYWIMLFQTYKQSNRKDARIGIAVFGVIYFLKSFFSMSYADLSYVVTCVLGYYLANYRIPDELIINNNAFVNGKN